jgi:hypothetical protein
MDLTFHYINIIMKTVKEAKIKYCENIASSTTMLRMDIIEQNMNAFDAGVEFAQRWIPIEEEMPPENMTVLARSDIKKSLWISVIDSNKKYRLIGIRDADYGTIEATHWRPINLK